MNKLLIPTTLTYAQPWARLSQGSDPYFKYLHAYKFCVSSTQLAKVMGISNYGSRAQFWRYKKGMAEEPEPSIHAHFGIEQEPLTAKLVEDLVLPMHVEQLYGADMYPEVVDHLGTKVSYHVGDIPAPFYLCASPDRLISFPVSNKLVGLEIKNRTADAKERIPEWPLVEHYTQCLQTMRCWDLEEMWLVYAINDQRRLKVFCVQWNQEAWDYCVGFLRGWADFVLGDTAPPAMKPGMKDVIKSNLQQFMEKGKSVFVLHNL